MRVYVDIIPLIRHHDDLAIGYDVRAGYEIDEHDELDIDELRKMNKEIEKVVYDGLSNAMNKRKESKGLDHKIDYFGLEPIKEVVSSDPLNKEVTITRTYGV